MPLDFLARENEIITVLENLTKANIDFVLVGGYAVSAQAQHRFSVDCDIVLSISEIEKVRLILSETGFKKEQEKAGFDQGYGGSFERHLKRVAGLPVTVDLLIASLVCKETQASWLFREIKSQSSELRVPGQESSIKTHVASKEFLIAFKLHAGRMTDARDIVVLAAGADWKKVENLAARGKRDLVIKQAKKILSTLRNPKITDSLKGVFTIKGQVDERIEYAANRVERLVTELTDADSK